MYKQTYKHKQISPSSPEEAFPKIVIALVNGVSIGKNHLSRSMELLIYCNMYKVIVSLDYYCMHSLNFFIC